MHLTQGESVWALGGNGEGDNEVRARGVGVDEGGAVSPELQNAADDLHHLRGATDRPVGQISCISFLKAAIINSLLRQWIK